MKTALRVVVTFFAFVASYYFVYWLPLSLIPGVDKIASLRTVISLVIAIALGVLVWKKTATTSDNLASHIIMGGIIVGAVGFILGFFGPIIFSPDSNQGPLLGIFFTGPLGFVLGLIGGAVYWKVRGKNSK
jgi:hypothetical protein